MPQWLDILLGITVGTVIVGAALAWACWPRRAEQGSWLAPPTGEPGDPTPGGSQWHGDGGGGFHGGGDGHAGW